VNGSKHSPNLICHLFGNVTLICYCCSQIFELCHVFIGFISYLYVGSLAQVTQKKTLYIFNHEVHQRNQYFFKHWTLQSFSYVQLISTLPPLVAQLFYTPLFTVKNIKWQIFTAIHPLLIFNLQQIYDPLGTESLSSQVKWPGCEDDFSLPTTAEVKNACKYTSTPPIRLHGMVLVKKRDLTLRFNS